MKSTQSKGADEAADDGLREDLHHLGDSVVAENEEERGHHQPAHGHRHHRRREQELVRKPGADLR